MLLLYRPHAWPYTSAEQAGFVRRTIPRLAIHGGGCGGRAGTDRLGHRLGHNTSGERQNKHSGFPSQLLVTELDIQVPFWENVKRGCFGPLPPSCTVLHDRSWIGGSQIIWDWLWLQLIWFCVLVICYWSHQRIQLSSRVLICVLLSFEEEGLHFSIQ